MRNILIIITCVLVVGSSTSYAAPITDSANPHNLSNLSDSGTVRAETTASGGTDEICVFCHTPHGSSPQGPLWNRPEPDNMGSFDVYGQPLVIKSQSATTGYNSANLDYPNGSSRLCLSCHDGVTSVGVLLDAEIVMEGGPVTLAPVDLSTSHPISFLYDATVRDLILASKPGQYQLPDGTIDLPLDSYDRMQCTTCHDPHEDTSALASYDFLPFWRHQGNASSYDDVCAQCHTGGPPSVTSHNIP